MATITEKKISVKRAKACFLIHTFFGVLMCLNKEKFILYLKKKRFGF